MAYIGYMFENGFGAAQNLETAKGYYLAAADLGSEFAQSALNNMAQGE